MNGCTYDECATDADCTKQRLTSLCYCNAGSNGRNACLLGNCKDDGDCTGGSKCDHDDHDRAVGSWCRTPRDPCTAGSPCAPGEGCGYSQAKKRWECMRIVPMLPG